MIKAKHNSIIYPFFRVLTRCEIRKNFHEVNAYGHFYDNGKSVLVIANHISWWDGFWIMTLNQKLFRRKIHFMMLEENLQKNPILKQVGGYSIKRKSLSTIESLDYSIEILKKPENLVMIFPQGLLHSIYDTDFLFERGIYYIMKQIDDDTQVVFVANLIDYFSNKKPEISIHFKIFSAHQLKNQDIQKEYNLFFQQSINKQKIIVS